MSEHSKISWTDSTWNPWRGCTKVSAGCANCYAERLVTTRMGGKWGKGAPRVRAAKATFNAPLRWQRKPWVCSCGEAMCPKAGTGNNHVHPRRVFFGSLMDWLDPEVPVEWLSDALDIVRRCPDLTFQLLSKRPELWRIKIGDVIAINEMAARNIPSLWLKEWAAGNTPPNVHVLPSIEDQRSADERIPHLLKIPAVVRGLSVEPILERIILPFSPGDCGLMRPHEHIHWVIVGGESGPEAREAKGGTVEAIADIVRQCQAAGVPCFVKQDCHRLPGQQGRIPNEMWAVKQFPIVREEVVA